MTVNEVAEKAGVTRSRVTQAIRTGQLSATIDERPSSNLLEYVIEADAAARWIAFRRKSPGSGNVKIVKNSA